MGSLRIVSYNIHKGFSQFNRRLVIHELRDQLHRLGPDIVFLQEVQGLHLLHAGQHARWPREPQHEFLAGKRWHAAYGGNASYEHGHHGNAILCHWPMHHTANHDITQHRLEQRGLLHCCAHVPGLGDLHLICVHLSLTEGQRRRQLDSLISHVRRNIPARAPLLIAGDFNDWRNRASPVLSTQLGLQEAFVAHTGHPARSYPSKLPMLSLDRIYVRGFNVRNTEVHAGSPWSRISDHAVLNVRLEPR